MRGLRRVVQTLLMSEAGSVKKLKRAYLVIMLITVCSLLIPQGWYGGGVAYCDDTSAGDAGDSGDGAGDDSGGDEGDAEGDGGADDDGADDGTGEDGTDDGAEDDEAADDEAADDEAADEEADEAADDEADAEDEESDADDEDDNGGDNEDEMEDDADSDDDSELTEDGSDSPLKSIRLFALDGMRRDAQAVPDAAAAAEWKKNHGSMKKSGTLNEFVLVQDLEEQLLGDWASSPGLRSPQENTAAPSQQSEESPDLKLPPTSLPRYHAGDTYVYSDGTWERVVAADSYGVRWVNYRGNLSSGSLDFTYKRMDWQTSTRKGSRQFQQTSYLFSKSTTTLWPLAVGNITRFDEIGRWSTGDGVVRSYDSFWRCEVEGTERIQVAAGEFDSWRITCARYSNSFSYPKSKAREYKTWNYAPSLNHWVVENRDNRGYRPNRTKELTAVMPDLLLLTGDNQGVVQLQEQFQDVLENYKSGQSDMWMEKSGAITSTIIPKATYMREDGVYCRQYVQYIQSADHSGTYGGIGCRGVDGMWRILRR